MSTISRNTFTLHDGWLELECVYLGEMLWLQHKEDKEASTADNR